MNSLLPVGGSMNYKDKKMYLNKRGQGLVEYLIIVAIVAIGSIAVIKTVGGNIDVQFANVAQALGGTSSNKKQAHQVTDNQFKKRDLSDFFEDSVNSKK